MKRPSAHPLSRSDRNDLVQGALKCLVPRSDHRRRDDVQMAELRSRIERIAHDHAPYAAVASTRPKAIYDEADGLQQAATVLLRKVLALPDHTLHFLRILSKHRRAVQKASAVRPEPKSGSAGRPSAIHGLRL